MPIPQETLHDRIRGVLFGSAYGDAYAARMEFVQDHQELLDLLPPPGELGPGWVTDDTQMMLAVGRALTRTPQVTPEDSVTPLKDEFLGWLRDPENTRAPGLTCLSACRALAEQEGPARRGTLGNVRRWQTASVPGSKGCGANMRVQPAAFIGDADTRRGYAQLQAALTHGHPTAVAAAELTAEAIFLLIGGLPPGDLLAALTGHAGDRRGHYPAEWLGDLWAMSRRYGSPQAYAETGWDECLTSLAFLGRALQRPTDPDQDACDLTGEGWVAEEALSTALLCFLQHQGEPLQALRRAALTRGDSDSVTCLTGALLGARHGLSAFPADWEAQIESRTALDALAQGLTAHPLVR